VENLNEKHLSKYARQASDGLKFCPEGVYESKSISMRNTREENMYTQCFTAD